MAPPLAAMQGLVDDAPVVYPGVPSVSPCFPPYAWAMEVAQGP